MNKATASRVNTTQATTKTAVAIQNRNDTTAARTVSTTTKGAARIFRTIISGYLL